jgi:ubiquinone/menaquinone biosynthesis C-methylase UbiE
MTAWYEQSFGLEYLDLYSHRDIAEARADIQAVIDLLDPPRDEPLLDLCCGACRHTLVLREMGFSKLVGLDLSQELLDAGREQLARVEDGTGDSPAASVCLVCSDMRAIPYEDHFSAVLSLFTSFGYFESDQENQSVFQAVYRALRPKGKFLIDYMNREYVIANLVERDEKQLPGRRVYNVRRLTPGNRRVEKTITIVTDAGRKRQFYESVRLYSEPEMRHMLEESGFVEIVSYGALDRTAFGPESKRLIIVAQKGES